jgi:hypothetical protein
LATDIDTAENRATTTTDEGRVKGVTIRRGNAANDPGKRGGVVTSESPQYATAGYITAWNSDEEVDDEDDEKASCNGAGVSRLEINGGEGELGDRTVKDLVEGGNSVEEDDIENEDGEKAGDKLGGDAFRDITLRVGHLFGD